MFRDLCYVLNIMLYELLTLTMWAVIMVLTMVLLGILPIK